MKLSTNSLLKIIRLYKLGDDNLSVKDLRKLQFVNEDDFVQVEFVLENQKFILFISNLLDEESLALNLWQNPPLDYQVLANPLDENAGKLTPFQGKNVVLYRIPSKVVRLDSYLANDFDQNISRSLWQKYIKNGCVFVNGQKVTTPKTEILETDKISVEIAKNTIAKQDLPIIYEDESVIVLDKPAGILTHAATPLQQEATVADFLAKYTTFAKNTNRAGVIHRLDRATSGVIIGAKDQISAKFLQKQFASRTVKKQYLAVIDGVLKLNKAKIDLPIARNPLKPSTFRVDPNGKVAETIYEVLAVKNQKSLVLLKPKTGRTHQLRVHLAYLGAPIVGDYVYGREAGRMMLHAYKLEITLPDGARRTFEAPLPEQFLADFPEIKL